MQVYTKYIHEDLKGIDIDTATFKDHLHKPFEWFACIQLSKKYNSTFLCWEDVPPSLREEKNMTRDMGIDAWDIEGNRVSQMKLYNGRISNHKFSTFIFACFTHFDTSTKILYRNTESKISQMIEDSIKQGKIIDNTILELEFRNECKRIQQLSFENSKKEEIYKIRPYQQEAISLIEKGINKNVYLCIPTGCGKTFIILEYVKHYKQTILVLVPRIILMEQWGDECQKLGITFYLIGTGQNRDLKKYKDELVVICVYDSFINIYKEQERFKKIVIDEAHHIKVPERYYENENENEDSNYMELIDNLSVTNKVIYISATLDKPDDSTSLFYEYKVRQAIIDGYLCDYQFNFSIFKQENVDNENLAKYLVYKQHESHCIIYASSQEDGKSFCKMLNKLRKDCAGYIDCFTSYKERQQLFEKFEKGDIHFLVNIKVLIEGFNAPHVRSIFFLHISSNKIFIIQAIGRALRLYPDKKIATIYVPFTSENDIEHIQSFLYQLSSYDQHLKDSIDNKKIGGYINIEKGDQEEDEDKKEDEDDEDDEKETIFEFKYNLIVDSMGNSNNKFEDIWKNNLEKCKKYIDDENKRPTHHSKDEDIKPLGQWLEHQTTNYKNNIYIMKDENIRKIWEEFIKDEKYKKYF